MRNPVGSIAHCFEWKLECMRDAPEVACAVSCGVSVRFSGNLANSSGGLLDRIQLRYRETNACLNKRKGDERWELLSLTISLLIPHSSDPCSLFGRLRFIMDNTVGVTHMAAAGNQWHSSTLDCCAEPGGVNLCLCAWLCPWCVYGQIRDMLDHTYPPDANPTDPGRVVCNLLCCVRSYFWYFCYGYLILWVVPLQARKQVRRDLGIYGEDTHCFGTCCSTGLDDCCTSFWCFTCNLCQLHNTIAVHLDTAGRGPLLPKGQQVAQNHGYAAVRGGQGYDNGYQPASMKEWISRSYWPRGDWRIMGLFVFISSLFATWVNDEFE